LNKKTYYWNIGHPQRLFEDNGRILPVEVLAIGDSGICEYALDSRDAVFLLLSPTVAKK